MPTPILLRDTAGSVTLYLQLSATGAAATGLTFSDVQVDIKKEGASSFSSKTLNGTNFTEFNNGFYELDLSSTDTNTLGSLYIRISGATISTDLIAAYVATQAPENPIATAPPATTAIFGFVYDVDGTPLEGASVSARVLGIPTLLHPEAEGIVLGTGLVTTKTASDGFFTMSLISGAEVDFFVPASGFRRTFTVPSGSINVFDIP